MTETREEFLLRTSEVFRRLHAQTGPDRDRPAIDLVRDATPPDTARALPQSAEQTPRAPPPGPNFVRRLFTRRLDAREIALLVLVALALWFIQR